jgi:hypothetical protein
MHAGAVIMVTLSEPPLWIALILFLTIIVSVYLSLAKSGWLQTSHPALRHFSQLTFFCRLHWDIGNDHWILYSKAGDSVRGELLPSSYCHPYLVVLNFKAQDSRWWQRSRYFSVVLLPDTTDSADFKRLRVLLRLRPSVGPNSSAV